MATSLTLRTKCFFWLSISTASFGLTACGGDGAPATTASGAGSAGAAGSGAAGASGKAGGPTAGASGASTAGAAGTSTGGKAGSGGTVAGGTAGASGSAGASGGSGGTSGCTKDDECPKVLSTVPANCATGKCDAGTCIFVSVDADGDKHGTAKCKANDETTKITIGDDCDDTDASISPEGWDGPAGDGKPNHCSDGVDQNCSGTEDDQKLKDGSTCTCTPGDVQNCSEDDLGKKVSFPNLVEGKPILPCKLGGRTCLASGKWGPCTGIKAPEPESCDEIDNDCNGVKDDDAADAQLWVWDADGDSRGAGDCPPVRSCKNVPPKDRPVGCKSSDCTAGDCANAAWKIASSTIADDCDDTTAKRRPGLNEVCDDIDNDCNSLVDDGVGAKKGWLFDADGDGYVGSSSPKRLDCVAPTVCPDGVSSCDVSRWAPDTTAKLDCNDGDGTINPNATETCGDTIDKNCNGDPNDDCGPCSPGETLECYTGASGNAFGGTSICKKGTAICGANGKPGECQGQVLPAATESCNGLDDNCDGAADEGLAIGDPCPVNGLNVGACLNGGRWACEAGGRICKPLDPNIGQNGYRTVRSPKADGSDGSYDWSCTDGQERQYKELGKDFTNECDFDGLFNYCPGFNTEAKCDFGPIKFGGDRRRFCGPNATAPACGADGYFLLCTWDEATGTCKNEALQNIKMGCR